MVVAASAAVEEEEVRAAGETAGAVGVEVADGDEAAGAALGACGEGWWAVAVTAGGGGGAG